MLNVDLGSEKRKDLRVVIQESPDKKLPEGYQQVKEQSLVNDFQKEVDSAHEEQRKEDVKQGRVKEEEESLSEKDITANIKDLQLRLQKARQHQGELQEKIEHGVTRARRFLPGAKKEVRELEDKLQDQETKLKRLKGDGSEQEEAASQRQLGGRPDQGSDGPENEVTINPTLFNPSLSSLESGSLSNLLKFIPDGHNLGLGLAVGGIEAVRDYISRDGRALFSYS